MTKMKSLLTKVAVFGLVCTPVLSTSIHAASPESFDEGITITVT